MEGAKSTAPARLDASSENESAVVPRMWEEDVEPSITDPTGALWARAAQRSVKRPALMVMAGSSAGRVFPITSEKVTVGRSKQAAFTLNDQGISRMHCGIACREGMYFLSDLGSTNGTLVNGGRTDRIELRPGDRIQLGPETVLQFDFYDDAGDGLVNKLYEAATRDLLTHALNRRAFHERLIGEVAYAVRHRAKLVAVAVDVDRFKAIIDSYSDGGGDSVLTEVAALIASTLRSEDVFARTCREKFVVLCRDLSLRKGAKLADRIRKLVEDRTFEFKAHEFRVTVSAGVAELAETGKSATGEELMELANLRLSTAKEGQNKVVTKG